MPTSTSERRRTPRWPTAGFVVVTFGDPAPVRVEAELVELSAKGFRAAHDSTTLEPGLEVLCAFGDAEPVPARVMWTHVRGAQRISGFLLSRPRL